MIDVRDPEYVQLPPKKHSGICLKKKLKRHSRRNPMILKKFAETCDRFKVSDIAGAFLATAVMEDLGLVTHMNKQLVVDKSKLRRARVKTRKSNVNDCKDIIGLYFDGRKDRTKTASKIIVEEHITVLSEPGSKYECFLTPQGSDAEQIADNVLQWLLEKNVTTENTLVIGCDGTNVNTGAEGGAIAFIENRIGHALQWSICMLHGNELPLRHLLTKLDGPTTGPNSYRGPIGRRLQNSTSLPVQDFECIHFPLQNNIELTGLSSDQQYLYDICQFISTKIDNKSIVTRSGGTLYHARWICTANLILRLYIGTAHPSEALKTLTVFIVQVYAPMWFNIKLNSSISDGPKNLFKSIEMSRFLPIHVRNIIDPVIERNGYFAHNENVLLSMLTDENINIRKLAVDRIIEARATQNSDVIRTFRVPKINFLATHYTEIIFWDKTNITEPPLTKMYSESDLIEIFVENSRTVDPNKDMSKFPCHTQAVERCVKLVTEVCSKYINAEQRHGCILTTLKSRTRMPFYNTKKDYVFGN